MTDAPILTGRERVLIVRLGAMGDILHALPAVESLKRRYPATAIDWIVKPHWMPILEGNPALRRLIPFDRDGGSVWRTARLLREANYDLAIDLQGLIQSALVARFSGAKRVLGYARTACREPLAAIFYGSRIHPVSAHIAEKHLDVVRALGVGEPSLACSLPRGRPEGELPDGAFVMASPFAGWQSKQWPLGHYQRLAAMLREKEGFALVLNIAASDRARLGDIAGVTPHVSSLEGLIYATRKAVAVVGADSGPLHLAAALEKPGVALFGPTDPARNGPLSNTITVLRDAEATVCYKRIDAESAAMRRISPESVFEALCASLAAFRIRSSDKEPA